MNDTIPVHLERLVKEVGRLAVRAGEAILEVYRSDTPGLVLKEDLSPLTLADKRSHQIIMDGLSVFTFSGEPRPVVSEEGGLPGYGERSAWRYWWCVDPLDGTKEFLKRNGEFTVNIALMEGDTPVFGIVYQPTEGILFCGGTLVSPWSARLEVIGQEFGPVRRLSGPVPVPGLIRVVASRSHRSAETDGFIKNLEKGYGRVKLVETGSSLKFCLVASGEADLYPRFAPTMEWDTAAADAVCRGAGCRVMEWPGSGNLVYGKESLRNPWFLVTGTDNYKDLYESVRIEPS